MLGLGVESVFYLLGYLRGVASRAIWRFVESLLFVTGWSVCLWGFICVAGELLLRVGVCFVAFPGPNSPAAELPEFKEVCVNAVLVFPCAVVVGVFLDGFHYGVTPHSGMKCGRIGGFNGLTRFWASRLPRWLGGGPLLSGSFFESEDNFKNGVVASYGFLRVFKARVYSTAYPREVRIGVWF